VTRTLRLGFTLGLWRDGPPDRLGELLTHAESLGYDSVWAPEAYGSDCLTPLAWAAARTTRLRLGTAVMQIGARQPTAVAMAAATLDHLSDGRLVIGLGVSGPQVMEGWYGVPFSRPLARSREYVQIIRDALRRDGPVAATGRYYPLPASSSSRPLKLMLQPKRGAIPILLGAEGPRNIELAAEIADGWIPNYYSPRLDDMYRPLLAAGLARARTPRSLADFEIAPTVPVHITGDPAAAIAAEQRRQAMTLGAMGAFHGNAATRIGYPDAVAAIQRHWRAHDHEAAAAAVPAALIEDVALIGTRAQVRDRLAAWRESLATTVIARVTTLEQLRLTAEAVLGLATCGADHRGDPRLPAAARLRAWRRRASRRAGGAQLGFTAAGRFEAYGAEQWLGLRTPSRRPVELLGRAEERGEPVGDGADHLPVADREVRRAAEEPGAVEQGKRRQAEGVGGVRGDTLTGLDASAERPGRAHLHALRVGLGLLVGRGGLAGGEDERPVLVHDREVAGYPVRQVLAVHRAGQVVPGLDRVEHRAVGGHAERVEDLLLVAEVGVEPGPRDGAGGGDLRDPGPGVPVLEEQLAGSGQDAHPGARGPRAEVGGASQVGASQVGADQVGGADRAAGCLGAARTHRRRGLGTAHGHILPSLDTLKDNA
jgi:F420-dependent oxidoreductase-like protein